MRKLIPMRVALADPEIFGNSFAGPSWIAWRTLLIAGMGESLLPEERPIFTKLTGRAREPLEPCEELVVLKGRRSGGTSAAAALLTYSSCLIDYSNVLGAGERGLALFLAPNARQAQIAFDRAAGLIDASPLLRGMVSSQTQDTISLSNNVDLEVRPASYRGLRGITAVAVCADEGAFFQAEGKNTDAEIMAALRPALITTRGMLMLSSTPYAKSGELHSLFEKYYGEDGPVLVARATSRDTNPTLSQSVIDRALERDATAARAEFLGEFRDDVSGFISRDMLQAAVDEGVTERPPVSDHLAFADAASGIAENDGDSFSLAIGRVTDDGTVIIDLAREWAPPFDASEVTSTVAGLLKIYGCDSLTTDGFSSGFVRSELARHSIGHKISDLSKSELYLATLPMLTSRRVRLLDNKTLIDQFASLERRPGSNGRDRIDARGHEDLANSVAGVVAMLSAAAPAPGWGILEHYRRQSEAAVAAQAAPPTLRQEHGHQAVMQIGARPPRPADFVKVIMPLGNESSHVMGVSGESYVVEFENDTRVVWVSKADAMALVGNPWANLAFHEANTKLHAELKAKSGPAPSRGVRVVDLLQAADDARPRSMFDRGGILNDTLRMIGRLR